MKTAINTIFNKYPNESSFGAALADIKSLLGSLIDPSLLNLLDAFNTSTGVIEVAINNSDQIVNVIAGLVPIVNENISNIKLLLQALRSTGMNGSCIDLIMNLINKRNSSNQPVLPALLSSITHNQGIANALNFLIYNNGNFNKNNLKEALRFFATPTDKSGRNITYKEFFDSVKITTSDGPNYYDQNSRTLRYSKKFRFQFTRDIRWDAAKLMKIIPYLNINLSLGVVHINLNDIIKKNFPTSFALLSGDYVEVTLSFDGPVTYYINPITKELKWQSYVQTKINLNMPQSMKYAWDYTTSPFVDTLTKPFWAEALQKIVFQVFNLDGYFVPFYTSLQNTVFPKYNAFKVNNNAVFTKYDYGPPQNVIDYVNNNSNTRNVTGPDAGHVTYKLTASLVKHEYYKTTAMFTGDVNWVANQLFNFSNMNSIPYRVSITTIELDNFRKFGQIPSLKLHKIELHLPTYVYSNGGVMRNQIMYMWISKR